MGNTSKGKLMFTLHFSDLWITVNSQLAVGYWSVGGAQTINMMALAADFVESSLHTARHLPI